MLYKYNKVVKNQKHKKAEYNLMLIYICNKMLVKNKSFKCTYKIK